MRTRRLELVFALVTSSAVACALFACTADESAPGGDIADANADGAVTSPDAAPSEGGLDADAGMIRDPYDASSDPVICAGAGPCAKQITAGRSHFCALMSDGTVRCWGSDELGALGGGAPLEVEDAEAPASSPTTRVAGLTNVRQISAGGATTCAVREDGTVDCWGDNTHGQLGLGSDEPRSDGDPHPTPERVAIEDAASRVDVGPRNACAVLATGNVACWGNNEAAQLARPEAPTEGVLGPALATLDPFAIQRIGLGDHTLLALTSGGTVVSWGEVAGRNGMLGGRTTSIGRDAVPKEILGLRDVTSLVATATVPTRGGEPLAHACALADGEVYCWGRSHAGALCNGLVGPALLPTHAAIASKAWPQQLAVGDEITCARMTDGSVQCCGDARKGRLGPDQTEPLAASFTPVKSFTGRAVQVATSDHAVCALSIDGTVACWGGNAYGELATAAPDEASHPSPVKITF